MMQKKNAACRSLIFFFFCFSLSPCLSAQESADAVVIPRGSWNGFLSDWTMLKQNFEELEKQHRSLQEHYEPLPPKLERLEQTLRQSEEMSQALSMRLEASGRQLAALNDSLKKQIGQTASLERKVRFFRTGFVISIGAAAGLTALLFILH
jgi:septal ring factor EnvC (AmiA/AmiB activator)